MLIVVMILLVIVFIVCGNNCNFEEFVIVYFEDGNSLLLN